MLVDHRPAALPAHPGRRRPKEVFVSGNVGEGGYSAVRRYRGAGPGFLRRIADNAHRVADRERRCGCEDRCLDPAKPRVENGEIESDVESEDRGPVDRVSIRDEQASAGPGDVQIGEQRAPLVQENPGAGLDQTGLRVVMRRRRQTRVPCGGLRFRAPLVGRRGAA